MTSLPQPHLEFKRFLSPFIILDKKDFMKDISGFKFGNWTALERKKQGNNAFWLCQCECGTKKWIRLGHLTSGGSKSCGCLISTDLIGKKFGTLTVIRKAEKQEIHCLRSDFKGNPVAGTVWLCKCDCGIEKVFRRGAIVQGQSCGKCYRKKTPEVRVNFLYSGLKSRAKKYGLEFSLTKENIRDLCFSECHYCGNSPSQKMKLYNWNARIRKDDTGWSVVYNGIDRRDNAIGYILENCVTCCKICNTMKNVMSTNEFIDHIKRILKKCPMN